MKNLLLITLFTVFGSSMYASLVVFLARILPFSTIMLHLCFTPVADANNAEASLTHNAGGFAELSGIHDGTGAGKAYIWLISNVAVPTIC